MWWTNKTLRWRAKKCLKFTHSISSKTLQITVLNWYVGTMHWTSATITLSAMDSSSSKGNRKLGKPSKFTGATERWNKTRSGSDKLKDNSNGKTHLYILALRQRVFTICNKGKKYQLGNNGFTMNVTITTLTLTWRHWPLTSRHWPLTW